MDRPIRIAIASEDRLCADALSAALALQGDFLTVPLPPSAEDGLGPEVVLIDAAPGRQAAASELWRLQELRPQARLVVFGLEREDEAVVELVEAGASGYVLRQSSPDELATILREVVKGEVRCSSAVLRRVAARVGELAQRHPPKTSPLHEPLTGRELEVLREMTAGLRNKEIGRKLAITVQTVKNHVHSILAKLGVHRRREAVRLGLELGLLAEPGPPPPSF